MILLIRHGEADHHVKELTGGWTDSALTVRGQQQFQQLADCLAGDFAGRACPGSFPAISSGPGPGPRSSPKNWGRTRWNVFPFCGKRTTEKPPD